MELDRKPIRMIHSQDLYELKKYYKLNLLHMKTLQGDRSVAKGKISIDSSRFLGHYKTSRWGKKREE